MTVVFSQPEGRVSVRVADAELAGAVAALFPVLSEVVEEGAVPGPGDLQVARAPDGFRLGEERYDTLPDLLVALELRLLRRLLEPLADRVHLHASAVLTGAGAVVAVGESGAGKSSLALAWARAGLPVLGDDLILVDGEGRVRGFPRLAKVHRDRAAAHGLSPAATLAPVPGHPELWVDLHRDARWLPGPHPVARVVRVRYEPGVGDPQERLRPLGDAALLQLLMEQRLSTGAQGVEALDALIRMVAAGAGEGSGELVFGDAGRAAHLLLECAAGVRA